MEIVGFAALLTVCLYFTFVFVLLCTQTLGRYNIGGVPNGWKDRVSTLVCGVILYFMWAALIEHAPFTVVVE